jgi:hypothetical protein
MRTSRNVLAALSALGALCALCASAIAPAALGAGARATSAPAALRRSLNLWATIDVCNPTDQRDYVGVRGSMPGDRIATDDIYMRFRLQVTSAAGTWVDLVGGLSPFMKVASAQTARQDGWSFRLTPRAGKRATLRGVVTFEWRRGTAVLARLSRATTAGHRSLGGADPPKFSAATCSIG